MKKRWKDYLASFIAIAIIVLAYLIVLGVGIFFNILPALVLGHMIKG